MLALIGVYGSVATGDEYEKSDLDLLILIQNDEGWQLGTGFILDDSKVGYDIYCTNWDGLKYDAECHHSQISKLMDSKIVYVKNTDAYEELCRLREKTKNYLESDKRFDRVNELVDKAKISYANVHLAEDIGRVRICVFEVMYQLVDAMMIYHGTYFKRGVKRTFEELAKVPIDELFTENMKKIAASKDISELRDLSKKLLLYTVNYIRQEKDRVEPSKELAGTYEEMYSNWRNKVEEAAVNKDTFASYMNMCSLNSMLAAISSDFDIGTYNIMDEYNSECLEENIQTYDRYLEKYQEVYKRAGIQIKRYANYGK